MSSGYTFTTYMSNIFSSKILDSWKHLIPPQKWQCSLFSVYIGNLCEEDNFGVLRGEVSIPFSRIVAGWCMIWAPGTPCHTFILDNIKMFILYSNTLKKGEPINYVQKIHFWWFQRQLISEKYFLEVLWPCVEKQKQLY